MLTYYLSNDALTYIDNYTFKPVRDIVTAIITRIHRLAMPVINLIKNLLTWKAIYDFSISVWNAIPWKNIGVTVCAIGLLYLSQIPTTIGILIGYTFSKAKDDPETNLDFIMKRIKEFVIKYPIITLFLGVINLPYAAPAIHLYCSLNVGRYMRSLDIPVNAPRWQNILPQRLRTFLHINA